ncbi:SprT-like domain-containing protein [Sinorhizobium medicae]|uniref:SprT-like domain-containing protein n=1 Tax=Sinorhizobium medicae TaxID=110321 RepID=UPI0030867798|nr:SprT-like domain-containing protein [Sinorhizobium medicae]
MNMQSAPALLSIKPTRDTYDRLQLAYEHFNKALFGNELPNALITLQRRKGTFGYFSGDRFNNNEGRAADEIALNPARFADRPLIDVLGTLVHEMVHLWQHHHGTPGRGRYHNREWADKMKSVGLQPTDTGEDGGKETGETVSHMIVPGGAFEHAAQKLIAKDFAITWKEAPAAPLPNLNGNDEAAATQKSGKRLRYACPDCALKAWAKHDARLICGDHMVPMVVSA